MCCPFLSDRPVFFWDTPCRNTAAALPIPAGSRARRPARAWFVCRPVATTPDTPTRSVPGRRLVSRSPGLSHPAHTARLAAPPATSPVGLWPPPPQLVTSLAPVTSTRGAQAPPSAVRRRDAVRHEEGPLSGDGGRQSASRSPRASPKRCSRRSSRPSGRPLTPTVTPAGAVSQPCHASFSLGAPPRPLPPPPPSCPAGRVDPRHDDCRRGVDVPAVAALACRGDGCPHSYRTFCGVGSCGTPRRPRRRRR